MIGKQRIKYIHSHFFLRMGTEDEVDLNNQIQSLVNTTGEALAGDEKLFRYTGRSGFVRLCPNKPAKTGIWHYQLVCYLPSGLPVLISTKAHLASTGLGMKLPCSDVVKLWGKLILEKGNSSILFMDSYYLDTTGRNWLQENNIKYIVGLKKDRFRDITRCLLPHVTKSGQHCTMFNAKTNEVATFHWSLDANVGKKLVLAGNCITRTQHTSGKRGCIPVYDEYAAGFAGCDNFNQIMHGKKWPFERKKSAAGADYANGWNYMFTSILLNCYHLWVDSDYKNPGAACPWVTSVQAWPKNLYLYKACIKYSSVINYMDFLFWAPRSH